MPKHEVGFTVNGLRRGARRIAPIAVMTVPFGIAFGAAALESGLTEITAVAMSGVIYAGAAQFALLDIWDSRVPLVPLIVVTFAINARHLLMGAALFVWIRDVSWPSRFTAAAFLTDANFADGMTAFGRGERDVGYLVGGGIAMWCGWTVGTLIGVTAGQWIGAPERFGLDAVMLVFFVTLLCGGWNGSHSLLPWMVAAAVSLACQEFVPGNWHVVAGAISGGIVGGLRHGR